MSFEPCEPILLLRITTCKWRQIVTSVQQALWRPIMGVQLPVCPAAPQYWRVPVRLQRGSKSSGSCSYTCTCRQLIVYTLCAAAARTHALCCANKGGLTLGRIDVLTFELPASSRGNKDLTTLKGPTALICTVTAPSKQCTSGSHAYALDGFYAADHAKDVNMVCCLSL